MPTDKIAKNTAAAAIGYKIQRMENQIADLREEAARERAAKLDARAEVRRMAAEMASLKQELAALEREVEKYRREEERRGLRNTI